VVESFSSFLVLLPIKIHDTEDDHERKNPEEQVMPVIEDKNSKLFDHNPLGRGSLWLLTK